MTSVEKHWKKTSFQEDIYFNITLLSTPLHHNLYSANCSLQFPYGTHGLYTDNLFPNQELLGNHFPYIPMTLMFDSTVTRLGEIRC